MVRRQASRGAGVGRRSATSPTTSDRSPGRSPCSLGRPRRHGNGTRRAETVNDADGFLANFWRALAHDPEAVAHWCDWPVNEVDLFARHLWLVNTGRSRLLEGMEADPDFYDAQVAGWWVWGDQRVDRLGWCSGDGPWVDTGDGIGKRPLGNARRGVERRLPLGNAGRGVNRKRPHLGDAGQGVNHRTPHLGDAGRGVNRQRPHLGNAGRAGYNNMEYRPNVLRHFEARRATPRRPRLLRRLVRRLHQRRHVVTGPRSACSSTPVPRRRPALQTCTRSTTTRFPAVRDWCLEHGDDPGSASSSPATGPSTTT